MQLLTGSEMSKTMSVFLCSLAKISCVDDCSKGRAYRAKVLKSVLQSRRDTRKSDSSHTKILTTYCYLCVSFFLFAIYWRKSRNVLFDPLRIYANEM